jgi:sigma-B regulation protein RsbU (phosphoserine phosphatase)
VSQRRRRDGALLEVEVVGVPIVQRGEIVGAVALYEDVTERHRIEAQLKLAQAALQAAANAILICDRNGLISWVNPAFTQLTGYTLEDVRGQNMRLLKSGKHPLEYYQQLWQTILAGEVWHGQTINRRKDSTLYTEEQTIAPVRDEQGEITHFISVKQPLTPRQYIEAALAQQP